MEAAGFVFFGLAVFAVVFLWRITCALESICRVLETGTVLVRDVDRAKVYKEHLGGKLQRAETPVQRETEKTE